MNWQEKTGEWARWFAWYPVCVEGRWYWLERIERKVKFQYIDYYEAAIGTVWEYRT